MKKTMTIFAVLFCLMAMGVSQSLYVGPYGVSPRDAVTDADDIFDRSFNGLLNVGVETQMYLQARIDDGVLTAPVWTVDGPGEAGFGATFDMNESHQVVVFTPDAVGTYMVTFTDGDLTDTITINSALYKGIADGMCGMCHSEKAAEWEETGHYSLFEDAMNGIASDHYASYCISCHTTGYDTNAFNNGFDDWGFVYPDSADLVDNYGSPDGHLFDGVFDQLFDFYPDAMELARIQCESCHGPGSAHFGNTQDNKMVAGLETDNCAWCHDSGTHHVYPEQWDYSGHAFPPSRASWSGSCARCHTPEGFIEFVDGDAVNAHETSPFSCAMCHDPHSPENPHQLRTVTSTELANGHVITEGGMGQLCMNCHMTRRDADSYSDEPHGHYGPHYGVQADMLAATNAVTFGQNLPTSPHLSALENACVDCHMHPGHVDGDGNVLLVGAHSWNMSDPITGVDNVASCANCHGDVGEDFGDKAYFFNGDGDHDGDGVVEGLQHEVEGLMETLAGMLPAAEGFDAYDPHDDPGDTWTVTELKAAYNYDYVYYDHSHGVHNPAYTVALLKVSIQALMNSALDGQIVAVDDVPDDQGGQVKVIWDAFASDGIGDDPVDEYVIKRYDAYDDTWVNVGLIPADGSDRYSLVVATLFDMIGEDIPWTPFKVLAITEGGTVYESDPVEGYSIDNLAPAVPEGLLAMNDMGTVELIWDEPLDADFQYFTVYRNGEMVGYTISNTFVDESIATGGEYAYTVTATDIHENISDGSDPRAVFAGLAGDPNGDFEINVLDIVLMVELALEIGEHSDFEFWAGDINGDGVVNILDIVDTVGIILADDLSRGDMINEASIGYGNGSLTIHADGTIAGFQMDLRGEYDIVSTNLPSGWEMHQSGKTVLVFNMGGESMNNDIVINYTGTILVESSIVADWYQNGHTAELVYIPEAYSLKPAYPNPFNPVTTIEFGIPAESHVQILVFDTLGRQVAELANGMHNAGMQKVNWNASNQSSGLYIVKMVAGDFVKTQKVMLVK